MLGSMELEPVRCRSSNISRSRRWRPRLRLHAHSAACVAGRAAAEADQRYGSGAQQQEQQRGDVVDASVTFDVGGGDSWGISVPFRPKEGVGDGPGTVGGLTEEHEREGHDHSSSNTSSSNSSSCCSRKRLGEIWDGTPTFSLIRGKHRRRMAC